MIAFVHYSATRNVGDLYSTPMRYFDWPDAQVFNLGERVPACDAVIYGGGSIEPVLRVQGVHRGVKARKRIAWGVGVSARGLPQDIPVVDDLDLIGLRDWGREKRLPGAWYVPCASCLLPHFDRDWPIRHEVVGFVNENPKRPAPDLGGLPVRGNRMDIDETIAWLASGHTVVTNSYHGTYWATLLGRRVVCIPYSSKFHGYRYAPAYAMDGNWQAALAEAREWPEALEDCRRINHAFHARVREEIGA